MRVLLVDDHPVVRAGLRALLSGQADIELVGEAASGEEAVRLSGLRTPDLVLMDLQLGEGMDGVDTTREILAGPTPPRVLVLTTYDADADILRAVEAGATGYLLKDADPDDLVRAIRSAASGETVLAPHVASRLLTRMRTPAPPLSGREIEILVLVAEGLSNRDIAKRLFISEATVKSHLVHVFGKLEVDSRTAAIAQARRRGLIR
ncbi:response regulator transcription factor [Solihabitans fulvus]|uniref:Response regulator transcription factor n=1 Tax=Solihabitans fulvus TaxID=1892852 RepID=A0A5B2WM92_9PSEU|nr:response regulator transcription factor [Solihabitans fulvus]